MEPTFESRDVPTAIQSRRSRNRAWVLLDDMAAGYFFGYMLYCVDQCGGQARGPRRSPRGPG